MSDHLSLFDIEREIHEIVSMWQEAETPEALEVAETVLREYIRMEVRKVDGIRRYLRACDAQAAAAKAEMTAQAQRVRMWESRRDRLKAFAFDAMQSFGVKKLEGTTGSLAIRGNGGKQAVTVTDENLVPDAYCYYEGRIPAFIWKPLLELAETVADTAEMRRDLEGLKMKRVPMTAAIGDALQVKCPECDGKGWMFDTAFPDDGEVRAHCESCNGLGTNSVAGARLEARGESLVVR